LVQLVWEWNKYSSSCNHKRSWNSRQQVSVNITDRRRSSWRLKNGIYLQGTSKSF